MSEETEGSSRAKGAVESTDHAADKNAPKVPLKASASRIKKPPFASEAPKWPQTAGENSSMGPLEPDAPASIIAPTGPLSWATSRPLLTAGLSFTAIWFGLFVIYISTTISWRELFLLLPDQFGGFLAVC
ncbi:MAG: hypothetical protein KDE14_05390, partial [Rhodobacteraceae bacterium]|nr:hypothetical protein [Paracoccaceae bacterium]